MSTLSINVARLIFLLSSSFQQRLWKWGPRFLFVSWLYTWILRCFSLSNKLREHLQKYCILRCNFFLLATFTVPPSTVLDRHLAKCSPSEANKSHLSCVRWFLLSFQSTTLLEICFPVWKRVTDYFRVGGTCGGQPVTPPDCQGPAIGWLWSAVFKLSV